MLTYKWNQVREIRFRNLGEFCSWNPECNYSRNPESETVLDSIIYMGRDKFVSPLIVSCLITRSCSQCQHQREASFFKLKNPTPSTGYDEIPPRVLKLASSVLALSPTNIFNLSIQTMPATGPKNEKGNMGAHSEEG